MSGGNITYSSTESPTIAALASVSSPILLEGFQRGSVQFPATISGNSFSVEVSNDGETFTQLQDGAGAPIANTPCAAGEACPLPSGAFAFQWTRLSMNGAAEASQRTLTIHLRS